MSKKNDVISNLLELAFLDEKPEIVGERLLYICKKIVDYDEGAILLLDRETEQFEYLSILNLRKTSKKIIQELIEEGVFDWVLERKVQMIIPSEKSMLFSGKNFLIVPFKKKLEIAGILCLIGGKALREADKDLLALFVGEAFLNIENSLLQKKLSSTRKGQLALTRILQGVESNRELEDILTSILKLVLKEIKSEYGFFLKFNKKKRKFFPWVSVNVPLSAIKKCVFFFKKGAIGYVVSTGGPLIADSYSEYILFQEKKELNSLKPRNLISVPFELKEGNMGVLTLCNTLEKSFYTRDDLDFLLGVGSLVTLIVKNKALYNDLRQSFLDTVDALIQAIEAKDPYTSGHSKMVTTYSLEIAKYLNLSREEKQMIRFCGLLHDIGKIGIKDTILNKPSSFTKSEYELIKKHPLIGEKIVEKIKFLKPGISIIRSHHERYNGYGYPDGLKGKNIPLLARILAVADAFDAMTSDRPYRKALTIREAIAELKNNAGSQFDPKIVDIFCQILTKSSFKRTFDTKKKIW